MSAFDDRLNELVGEAGDTSLISYSFVPCWQYHFTDGTLARLWAGRGKLYTLGGAEWLGTVDQAGRDHHVTPKLTDGRDGSSVQVRFELPYLDQETYEKLRDEAGFVNGAVVTAYLALFEEGEGLRPQIPLRFFRQYTLQSTAFREARLDSQRGGGRVFSITAIGKNGNVGRSQSAGGTMTDPTQQARAAYWGQAPDYGAGFVAELANATRQFP